MYIEQQNFKYIFCKLVHIFHLPAGRTNGDFPAKSLTQAKIYLPLAIKRVDSHSLMLFRVWFQPVSLEQGTTRHYKQIMFKSTTG